jgi:hypothetical protein
MAGARLTPMRPGNARRVRGGPPALRGVARLRPPAWASGRGERGAHQSQRVLGVRKRLVRRQVISGAGRHRGGRGRRVHRQPRRNADARGQGGDGQTATRWIASDGSLFYPSNAGAGSQPHPFGKWFALVFQHYAGPQAQQLAFRGMFPALARARLELKRADWAVARRAATTAVELGRRGAGRVADAARTGLPARTPGSWDLLAQTNCSPDTRAGATHGCTRTPRAGTACRLALRPGPAESVPSGDRSRGSR